MLLKARSLADALETWTVIEPEVLKNGDFKSFQEAINNIKNLKTEA